MMTITIPVKEIGQRFVRNDSMRRPLLSEARLHRIARWLTARWAKRLGSLRHQQSYVETERRPDIRAWEIMVSLEYAELPTLTRPDS